jgi:gamma-glutamyltranspeptidase/glutathione hydrolase
MDVQQAVDAARFQHFSGRRVGLEGPITGPVRDSLAALGHQVEESSGGNMGGAQAIARLPRGYVAGSDPRKDGAAMGH